MDIKIRRLENNLITLGTGIIAFSIWSFIKFMLSYFFVKSNVTEIADDGSAVLIVIMTWGVAVLNVLIYLWLGLSARAEGIGKRKRIIYLIVIGFIITYSVLIVLLEAFLIVYLHTNLLTLIITLIIDLTRLIFLIELLYSSVALRRLRKHQVKKEECTA